jgi:hypothetical protein
MGARGSRGDDMSVAPLVEELVGKGVRLSVEGGELKCRGPKSALTPEIVARLKAHKAEVIAHLLPAPEAPPVEPPKATPGEVERLLENPPYWLAGSYLPAYHRGRHTLEVLAYAVTAALKLSPYDADAVGEIAEILRGLGYRDSCAPRPFEHNPTEFGQDDERGATWA